MYWVLPLESSTAVILIFVKVKNLFETQVEGAGPILENYTYTYIPLATS